MADSGRRTILWVGLAVFAVVALLAAVGAVVDSGDGGGETDETLAATGAAAGCGPVDEADSTPPGGKHRAGTIDYDEAPPHSGEHAPNTLRNAKRFYSREDNPNPEQAVHNLEHGLVVAWYDDELPDDQVAILQEASQGMGARYVAVPWTRSAFDGTRHFALTAWGVRQYCERVSPEHIKAFIDAYADTDAPEKGYSV
jgi:Protein of unknown function (DUF3105)